MKKKLIATPTYEFFLNTSMIVMVTGIVFMTTAIGGFRGFWGEVLGTAPFLILMTFFASAAIKREVRSPIQRMIFWSTIVVWTAPVTFASLYLVAENYTQCLENSDNTFDYLYFSYVTFTTLGYGDIQPKGVCKALSASEAVLGYIFLGILVSAFSRIPPKN